MRASVYPPLQCATELLCLIPVTLFIFAASDPIPYITYGPGIVSPGGWYTLYTVYGNSSSLPYVTTAPVVYVPYNQSAPSLSIGLSLSLGRQSVLKDIQPSLQFIVDLINFRGGVNVRGVPHYISLSFAMDDASDTLTQIIYQDMAISGQYVAYLSPYGDAGTQALQSFLSSSQVLMMSVGNADPADFLGGDNLFSLLNTADLTWKDLLTAVNNKAADLAAGGWGGTVMGIQTLCMFSSDAVLVQAAAQGVRDWIRVENVRRGVEPITVYADVTWSMNVTGTYVDYAAIMLTNCPDGVDVMVLQDGSQTDLNVVLALTASQLKPKAVMGISYQNSVVLAAASGKPVESSALLAGWLLTYPVNFPPATTLSSKGGKLGSSYDAGYAQHVWNRGANISMPTPNIAYAYWVALDVLQAAISQAVSLNTADLRDGMLSLNGEICTLGLLNFSSSNGVNVAALSIVRQMNALGAISNLQTGTADIIYPYPWPWPAVIKSGDEMDALQSNGLVLVAVVICVLGAWVGQIIIEQSIFVRRNAGLWQVWLVVVALALGGVGVWCSQLMMASAVEVAKPNGSTLAVQFSSAVAMLALLPAVILTWCGLMVLMIDLENSASRGVGHQPELRRQLEQHREGKRKIEALSTYAHVSQMLHVARWRAMVGGLIITAAVILSRFTLWHVWVHDATWGSAGWAWVVMTILDAALIPLSTFLFFHTLRGRILAAFLFAAAVITDWQIQLAGLTFYYGPGVNALPVTLHTGDISSDALQLVVGILAALICLIFVGLQFSRMRLSRNGLTMLVASLEAVIDRQRRNLRASTDHVAQLKRQLDQMARLIELININSPLPTEYGFVMASCATYSTFANFVSPSTSLSAVLNESMDETDEVAAPQQHETKIKAQNSWQSRNKRISSIESVQLVTQQLNKSALLTESASDQSARQTEAVHSTRASSSRLSTHTSSKSFVANRCESGESGNNETAATTAHIKTAHPFDAQEEPAEKISAECFRKTPRDFRRAQSRKSLSSRTHARCNRCFITSFKCWAPLAQSQRQSCSSTIKWQQQTMDNVRRKTRQHARAATTIQQEESSCEAAVYSNVKVSRRRAHL